MYACSDPEAAGTVIGWNTTRYS